MSTVHCAVCSTDITNIPEDYLKKQYYQEEYPDILIGPYCVSCFQKIRICCGCQKPLVKDESIKYFNKGLWYCTECSSNLTTCSKCNSICSKTIEVNGEELCENCISQHYFYCDFCKSYHKNNINVFDDRNNVDARLFKAQYPTVSKMYPKGICGEGFGKATAKLKPVDVKRCDNCGDIKSSTGMENSKYCKSCYKAFYKCAVCGDKHPHIESYRVDGKAVRMCRGCFNKLHKCDMCGNATHNHTKIEGKFRTYKVCKPCYENNKHLKECKMCLNLTEINEDGICYACESIYVNNKCGYCGATKDFDNRCRSCGGANIYNYSTKPHLHFNMIGEEIGELFFGIENEMTFQSEEDQRKSLKELYKSYDPTVLLAKSDGSIRGPGYELVTQPMTFKYFNNLNIAPWFNRSVKSSSCGLHVHMDRASFLSEVHLYKMINFIHNHTKLCNKVAGRDYNDYNRRIPGKPSQHTKKGSGSRYCRVNTSGRSTVEIRMFAGCTTEFEMRYRVEFLHALWKFTRDIGIKDSNKDKFLLFLKEEQKVYHNLCRFLSGTK